VTTFQQIQNGLNRAPRQERRVILRDSLKSAANDVPELERLRRVTAIKLGEGGMRELAHMLCLWGEREGILDAVFPLETVQENEQAN
jgi:hypothetical protein